MARCGCAGQTCSCVLVAGDGVVITGSGSAANPFIISADSTPVTVTDTNTVDLTIVGQDISAAVKLDPAPGNLIVATANGLRLDCAALAVCGFVTVTVAAADTTTVDTTVAGGPNYIVSSVVRVDPAGLITINGNGLFIDCAAVRTCFTGINGVTFNAATGEISACISTDVGNTLTFGADGCLFVPAGASIVQTTCGLFGDGSAFNPLGVLVNGFTWPFACDQTIFGGKVYCDPATGALNVEPEKLADTMAFNGGTTPGTVVITTTEVVVDTAVGQFVNPSSCHDATLLVIWEADITLDVAPGNQVTLDMNNDGMFQVENPDAANTMRLAIQQARGFRQQIVPAGGVFNFSQPFSIRSDTNAGSTYNRTQWRINGILVSR